MKIVAQRYVKIQNETFDALESVKERVSEWESETHDNKFTTHWIKMRRSSKHISMWHMRHFHA